MNDAPELYAIVKEWEKELKREKTNKRNRPITERKGDTVFLTVE